MATTILGIAFITVVAFAVFRLVTRSNQARVRSYLRIGAFAAFCLLIAVSVIHWSFRWYGLALLLLIWAALGVWALVGRRVEAKAYTAKRVVLGSIGTMLLVLIALVPALIFPQVKLPPVTGQHEVATATYTYTDASRIETFASAGSPREVNVEFWYPKDGGGPYPLIVFSHGSFGTKTSNTSTFLELASNGYVVCSIDHPYHSLVTVDADGRRTMVDRSFLQAVIDVNGGKYDEAMTFRLEQQWMDLRTADINFVLDTILAQVKDTTSDVVYRLIDPTKIGLMGHSLGGESSAQVARERKDIDAVVNLDSNLHGEYLDYVDGNYVLNQTPYPVPLLNVLTDTLVRMIDAVPNADQVVAVEHVKATTPDAYEVHLEGTNHMTVTDVPLISPLLVSLINAAVPKAGGQAVDPLATIETMNDLILRFFNATLKGDGDFTVALSAGMCPQCPA